MRKDSIFGKIQFITSIGYGSSFMFEEGNVLVVTELSEETYKYFVQHIEMLEKIRSVIFCLTDRTVNKYRLPIYVLIKNYNNSILINFLSLSQKSYIEDSEIREVDDLPINERHFYFIQTNNNRIRIELLSKPEHRVVYQVGDSDFVMYTGLSGKIYTKDPTFNEFGKHIIMINRCFLGNLPTELIFDSYERMFNLNMLNTIFMGYKNNLEKRYFEKKINELWQPKVEALATRMNTALEKAKETETEYKRLYTENNVRITDFENN